MQEKTTEGQKNEGWFQWGPLIGKLPREFTLDNLKEQALFALNPLGTLTKEKMESEACQALVRSTVESWINTLYDSHPGVAERLDSELNPVPEDTKRNQSVLIH